MQKWHVIETERPKKETRLLNRDKKRASRLTEEGKLTAQIDETMARIHNAFRLILSIARTLTQKLWAGNQNCLWPVTWRTHDSIIYIY